MHLNIFFFMQKKVIVLICSVCINVYISLDILFILNPNFGVTGVSVNQFTSDPALLDQSR